jgi:hypothetical protein
MKLVALKYFVWYGRNGVSIKSRDRIAAWLGAFACLISLEAIAAPLICSDGTAPLTAQVTYRLNDSLYRLTPCRGSWDEARIEAIAQGGELASILNPTEQLWLLSKFGRQDLGKLLWIGLTSSTNTSFSWVDGNILGFANFLPIMPGTECAGSGRFAAMSTAIGGWVARTSACPASPSPLYGIVKLPAATACTLDIDGDGQSSAGLDGVLLLRYQLGVRGDGLINGLALAGPRKSGSAVEEYLAGVAGTSPFGISNHMATAPLDGLVLTRLMKQIPDSALLSGVTPPVEAQATTASAVRSRVNAQCGTNF